MRRMSRIGLISTPTFSNKPRINAEKVGISTAAGNEKKEKEYSAVSPNIEGGPPKDHRRSVL
jgi:hypothetical protein